MNRRDGQMKWVVGGISVVSMVVLWVGEVRGFAVSLDGEGYASRWDATTRTMFGSSGADDRSLVGGLSWATQGGLGGYYSRFTFGDGTSLAQFESVILEAFGAWMSVDPSSGFGSAFTFVMSDREAVGNWWLGGDQLSGAEIDLLAHTHGEFGVGGFTRRLEVEAGSQGIELTSGVEGYGGRAIVGADIFMNESRTWTADEFRLVLAHEVGIALGFRDVDVPDGSQLLPPFWDDNYDPAMAAETLTNAWSAKIDPLNPEGSAGVSTYQVANGDPGFDTAGVDLLMETDLGAALLGLTNPLTADEYAGRQFLYPVLVVPEPGVVAYLLTAVGLMGWRRRC